MIKEIDIMKEAVVKTLNPKREITESIISILIILIYGYSVITGIEISESLITAMMLILGFYFGKNYNQSKNDYETIFKDN